MIFAHVGFWSQFSFHVKKLTLYLERGNEEETPFPCLLPELSCGQH